MRNQGALIIGGGLILIGLVSIISSVFDINLWAVCWPVGLILIGLFLLFRPKLNFEGSDLRILPIGDLRRRDPWNVQSETILSFVGDMRYDFSLAEMPPGETRIQIYGFVNSVRIEVDPDTPISVSSSGFVTDSKILGRKRDYFFDTARYRAPDYEAATAKVHLEIVGFVVDLDIIEA